MNAVFRFYGPLNDFLPPERCLVSFGYTFLLPGSVKDMIEAAGVPHPEVHLILANGTPVEFSYLVQDRDRIAVFPVFHSLSMPSLLRGPLQSDRLLFVLDTHLGVLARYLRMLGFDAIYRNVYDDVELAEISSRDNRILLTRDRGLLKRGEVIYGYWVRETAPRKQLREVVQRYSLETLTRPFERCIHCNQLLRPASKQEVRDRLPARTAEQFDEFTTCDCCRKVYWRGSHFERMKQLLADVLAA